MELHSFINFLLLLICSLLEAAHKHNMHVKLKVLILLCIEQQWGIFCHAVPTEHNWNEAGEQQRRSIRINNASYCKLILMVFHRAPVEQLQLS